MTPLSSVVSLFLSRTELLLPFSTHDPVLQHTCLIEISTNDESLPHLIASRDRSLASRRSAFSSETETLSRLVGQYTDTTLSCRSPFTSSSPNARPDGC